MAKLFGLVHREDGRVNERLSGVLTLAIKLSADAGYYLQHHIVWTVFLVTWGVIRGGATC